MQGQCGGKAMEQLVQSWQSCSKVATKCSACKYPWGFHTRSNQFYYVPQVAATVTMTHEYGESESRMSLSGSCNSFFSMLVLKLIVIVCEWSNTAVVYYVWTVEQGSFDPFWFNCSPISLNANSRMSNQHKACIVYWCRKLGTRQN